MLRGLLLALTMAASHALDNGLALSGPAMGWSSWNHFGGNGSHGNGRLNATTLGQICDAMISSGLRDAGYKYVNLDDGWAIGRFPNGTFMHDPELFPHGIKPVADYIHSRGMFFGIYTARGSFTCMGRPGSDSHETIDANSFAEWGVDYVKEDSCGGKTHGSIWEQYARMRDALNASTAKTGRPIYYSITGIVPYNDAQPNMHCIRTNPKTGGGFEGAFTVRPWVAEGRDPGQLANSYLVEYCNNADNFGYTGGHGASPYGFLSQLDSQQLLTYDNLTSPGSYSDLDMLEVCNSGMWSSETVPPLCSPCDPLKGPCKSKCPDGSVCPYSGVCPHADGTIESTDHGWKTDLRTGAKPRHPLQSWAEYRSQFSTFAILTSPLILGNDPRSMSKACLDIIANKEIIELSQDKLVTRAKLVYQWPDEKWPNASWVPPSSIWPPHPDHPLPAATPPQAAVNITMQAWSKKLHDGSTAALAFNRGKTPLEFTFTAAMLEMTEGEAATGTVRDLWQHKSMGAFGSGYKATVGAHDVVAIRVRQS